MINNEVELTRTVNPEEKNRLVSMLVKAGVSYLEKWERIPFFKRGEYHGAKEICVIFINNNQGEQAREVLERFRTSYGKGGGEKKAGPRRRRTRSPEGRVDISETASGGLRDSALKSGKAGARTTRLPQLGRSEEDELGSLGTLKTRSGDKSSSGHSGRIPTDRSSVAGVMGRGALSGRSSAEAGESVPDGRFKRVKFRDSGEEVLQEEIRTGKSRKGPDPFLDTSDLDEEF